MLEHAKETCALTGLPLSAVLTRGSQLHVEALYLRLLSGRFVIPTAFNRESMPNFSSVPLVFEPLFAFNSDPVVVLDFQSLYPSIIVAYNYCYSTCFGKIDDIAIHASRLGCIDYQADLEAVKVSNSLNIGLFSEESPFLFP